MTICETRPEGLTHTRHLENLLPADFKSLLMGLAGKLYDSLCAADENLGHLEEELLRGGHEVFRQMLEKAAQQKADAAPPLCPKCQNKLGRLSRDHGTTIQTRFGLIRVERARGYCKRCRKWRFPADHVLGLPEEGTQSPGVQEIAALTVSQMPAQQAEHLVERLTGIKVSAATLGRQAREQGQQAEQKRDSLDGQMSQPEGRLQQDSDLQLQLALQPFTLVIELDAWNIRERDDWGQSVSKRAAGEEPSRWHWVYGGTSFRLDQRGESDGGRAHILSRGTVMTRGFLIGVLILPALLALAFTLGPRLLNQRSAPVRGQIAVVDPTGRVAGELREAATPQAIGARRAEAARRVVQPPKSCFCSRDRARNTLAWAASCTTPSPCSARRWTSAQRS